MQVGARGLRGLGAGDRVAGVLPAVGQQHEAVGLRGRRHRERELHRLEEVRPARVHLGPRPLDRGARPEGLVHHGPGAEGDHAVAVARLHVADGLGDEPVRALPRGEAHAVREVEQEQHVHPVHPAGHGRAGEREDEQRDERAAERERPAIARAPGRPQPAGALPPPVEQRLEREQQRREEDEEGPELALDRYRRRGHRARRGPGRQGLRREVRLVGVHQVDGDLELALRHRERVDPDLVGLGEAHDAAGHARPDHAAARRRDEDRLHAVRHRQQDRLPGRELEARVVEPRRGQPAQGVGEDQRERDPQREVGPEQVEADDEGLALGLLERVEQRPADRLDERPAGGERPEPHRVLDRHLRELDVPHHRVVPVPVHHGRLLEPAEHLERHVGRHRVDEHEPPRPDLRGRHRVEHDDVGLAHPPRVLFGRADLQRHLRVGPEDLLEEEVAGAHQQHRDLPEGRQHRPRDVVHGEVVADAEARGEDAAARVAERHDDRPPHARLEGDILLGDRPAVDVEREGERPRLRRVVDQRDERLIVERAPVRPPDGEARDADVVAAPPDPDPADARIRDRLRLRRREGAVGEHVDLGARVVADQRARRAHRLRQPVRQVAGPRRGERRERARPVAAQRGGDARLDARLDHHHLGALAQAPDELGRLPARDLEARRRDVPRAHRGRGVEHDHHLARPVAHDRGDRARECHGEREQREDLEDQERVALQPLEERRGLAVAQSGRPQQQARHGLLAPPHLQEVQEDERQGQREERERQRREEAHTSTRPRSAPSTNSAGGVSVTTRW